MDLHNFRPTEIENTPNSNLVIRNFFVNFFQNAKQVVDELGAGLRVEMGGASEWQKMSIQQHAISDGVKELMG